MASPGDITTMISELFELVVNYVKQQTIIPLKRVIRFISLGIVGSLFMAIGLFLLTLGFLRFLQTLSPFEDTFSFAPYLLAVVADFIVIGIMFGLISKNSLIPARKEVK